MTAYYNEFDSKAAAWLRQLIKNGDIADGVVDERDIREVKPGDLEGFNQCHFFAGIGVWSYALRNAGWADDRHVWTASLPCQPFSTAGKRKGKDDERHLLPHFLELFNQCRPNVCFGEQVPGAIRQGWLDDLYDEMERESYAVGATVLTAAGAGLPHIRQRIYWVAHASSQRLQRHGRSEQVDGAKGWEKQAGYSAESGEYSRVGNTEHNGYVASEKSGSNEEAVLKSKEGSNSTSKSTGTSASRIISGESINWLYCRDNKYRPIKSSIKPLVARSPRGMVHSSDSIITPNDSAEARTQRLKGYGNAIVAPVAESFIRAFMEITK